MFSLIGVLLVGIAIGYFIQKRRRSKIFDSLPFVMNMTIGGLLFLLGITIGGNRQIMGNITLFGIDALYISLGGIMGSLLFAWLNYRLFFAKGKMKLSPPNEQIRTSSSLPQQSTKMGRYSWIKDLLPPIIFFGAGIVFGSLLLFGHFHFFHQDNDLLFYLLHFLMFLVGVTISQQKQCFHTLCSQKYVLLLIPLGTILGTLLGCGMISLCMKGYTLSECLVVGSGMGYYSVTSVLISKYASAELGTVALLANIFREIITLLFAGVMAKTLGDLAPIAAGGSTTADVTLPVISHYVRQKFVMIAIFHGIFLDFCVPFLVTFFLCF